MEGLRHQPGGTMAGDGGCTAAELFEVVWRTLVDAVGPAATAALLQRSIKVASAKGVEAAGLTIRRERFDYLYKVPPRWRDEDTSAVQALRGIVDELVPLLSELTGSVVVKRLREAGDLVRCGVVEEQS